MATQFIFSIFIILFSFLFSIWARKNENYFTKRGFKCMKPMFLFGNVYEFVFKKSSAPEFIQRMYNSFRNERVMGVFSFRQPIWLLRDPEIVKQIAVKDFDCFMDHRPMIGNGRDVLFGNGLALLKGDKWRDMRSTLSPAFTGSKMRQMFELVSECADDLVKELLKLSDEGRDEFEMKELFSFYTNDVIASCAFGIKINSIQNPDNEFMKTGQALDEPSFILRMIFLRFFSTIARLFDIQLFKPERIEFFRSMILNTMSEREKHKIFRPDMINILLQVRQGGIQTDDENGQQNKSDDGFATVQESEIRKRQIHQKWSDDEIIAQCFFFFIAGFESSSTLLLFLAHELRLNPNVEQKLYEEVKSVNDRINGKQIDYDTLQKMKYLDQVVSEVLRKWPTVTLTDRLCVKSYTYDDGGTKFHVDKGSAVWIPIYSFHHEAKFFDEPEKFNPDRFSDENKAKIIPGTFIPFGIGPRNCIGSRFALMTLKAIVYYIMVNFKFEKSNRTEAPILKKFALTTRTEKGFYMKLKKRIQ